METGAYSPLSRPYALSPAAEAIRQLDAHLFATHGVTGSIIVGTEMAILRLNGLTVWFAEGEFRWTNGLRDADGLPDMDSESATRPATTADRVFERYQQVRHEAGYFAVRID
ncbi:hypothetical protein ACFHYQ_13580 [Sphaerimonospora cavernae]|uniref:Immunity protein 35 of polymorphic toxin system n=1 Tax=Sphaerimonospora cavernae TaxID=1740611 RepID=A0ABV6U5L9_9ACTN